MHAMTIGLQLAGLGNWKAPILFVESATKTVLLELRQEHLAMGCPVRCYSNFHLSDT